MIGRRKQPKVRTAVMAPSPDPALVAVTAHIAAILSDAEARLDRVLQRLRAQVPKEEETTDAR